MQVSYNYYETLETFCKIINNEINSLKNELLLDTNETTNQDINTLLNQKITYLRHLFLRLYSLNEWITTNYDYYCKANITNHVLDLREKGFKTISEYYYHLTNSLRHRKTPIWAVDMAVMNTVNAPSDLYSKHVMKYLINRNFEVPSPIQLNTKKDYIGKLNTLNLHFKLEDTKVVYTSEAIKVVFDILGECKNYYITIEQIEILNTDNVNIKFIKSYLNTKLKHINKIPYSSENLKTNIKETYEQIKGEEYFKLILCFNFIEKYIFEYKLNILEDIITSIETSNDNDTIKYFDSKIPISNKRIKKAKSFFKVPLLSTVNKTNCVLKFDKQNKTKLYFIFWDDYKNQFISLQTLIIEIYFENLDLIDNETVVIKMHGFEGLKEFNIQNSEILNLFKNLLNFALSNTQKVNECLNKLQNRISYLITETVYNEIVQIFNTHCEILIDSIIKIGFNINIDYNTGSLLLYSLNTNKILGNISKGIYNTDFTKNLEDCKLQNTLNEYISYVVKNIINHTYFLYILHLSLNESVVIHYTENKVFIVFKETNITLNITEDLLSSYYSFNNKQFEYHKNDTNIKITTVSLYKNYIVMSEASFKSLISKLNIVYYNILEDKINDFINELENVNIFLKIEIKCNKRTNNQYYMLIQFNECLFTNEYFEILNKTKDNKFINIKGTTEYSIDIKTAFKETFFKDLKEFILNSLKIERVKDKLIGLELKGCSFINYCDQNSFKIQYKKHIIEVNSEYRLKYENLTWQTLENQLSYCLEAFENAIDYKLSLDKIIKAITKNQRSIYEFCSPFIALGLKEKHTLLEKNVHYVLHEVFDMNIYLYGTKVYTVKIKPFNTDETAYTGVSYIRSAKHMVWSIPTFYAIKHPLYFFESCKNLLFLRLAYTDYLRTVKRLSPENNLSLKLIEDNLYVVTKSDRINKLIAYINKKLSERLILLFFKSFKSSNSFVLLKIMSLEALERACCIIMNLDDLNSNLNSVFRVNLSNKKIVIVKFEYCKTNRKITEYKILFTSFEKDDKLRKEVDKNLSVLIDKANKRFEGGSRKDVIVDNSELAPQILELILRGLCGQIYN